MFDRRSILFLGAAAGVLIGLASSRRAKPLIRSRTLQWAAVQSYQWDYFVTTRARSSFDPPDRRAASDTVSFLPGSPPTARRWLSRAVATRLLCRLSGSTRSSSAGHGVHGLAARGTDDYARSYAESTLGWIPQSGTALEFSPQGHIRPRQSTKKEVPTTRWGDPVVATWNLPAGPKVLNIFEVTGSANTGEARWYGPGIEFTDVINGHFEITIPSDGFLVSPGLGGLRRFNSRPRSPRLHYIR